MKKTIKILCLVLCAFMTFACAFGCGNSGTADSGNGGGQTDVGTNPGNNGGQGDQTDPGNNPGTTTPPEEDTLEYTYTNVLKDPHFDNGFGVMGQRDGNQATFGFFRPEGYTSGKAAWKVGQWYSGYYHKANPKDANEDYPEAYDIVKAIRQVDGTRVSYTDASKTFAFDNTTGEIYMELNASSEYTAPREKGGDPWPHLLTQYYTDEEVKLSKYDAIQVNLDYTVNKATRQMTDSEYKAGLHAAQLVWYVVLKNCNENSTDVGKYIWFGIGLYDNRSTLLGTVDSYSMDVGSSDKLATGVPIYTMAGAKTHKELPKIGENISVSVNILPGLKSAFEKASAANGPMRNSKWTDMCITDGNFGWELPGTFDCAVTFTKFEINAGKVKA